MREDRVGPGVHVAHLEEDHEPLHGLEARGEHDRPEGDAQRALGGAKPGGQEEGRGEIDVRPHLEERDPAVAVVREADDEAEHDRRLEDDQARPDRRPRQASARLGDLDGPDDEEPDEQEVRPVEV